VFKVDIRGDGLCELRFDTKLNILAAHCHHPDHGPKCRVHRTLNKSDVRSRGAQGRPAGFLLAWMKCAGDYPTQGAHHEISKRGMLVHSLSFEARREAREWATSRYPDFAAFLDTHEARRVEGDPIEPADVC
jgi:hypothetical protein